MPDQSPARKLVPKHPDDMPEQRYQNLLANYRDLAAAVGMIRESVEERMAPGALPASEQFETLVHECEAIALAIATLEQPYPAHQARQATPRERLAPMLTKKPPAPSMRHAVSRLGARRHKT